MIIEALDHKGNVLYDGYSFESIKQKIFNENESTQMRLPDIREILVDQEYYLSQSSVLAFLNKVEDSGEFIQFEDEDYKRINRHG